MACMVVAVAFAAVRGLSDELAYIFDDCNGFRKAYPVLLHLRGEDFAREFFGLGTFAPGDKISFPQIQAADTLAYCLSAHDENPAWRYNNYFMKLWDAVEHRHLDHDGMSLFEETALRVAEDIREEAAHRRAARRHRRREDA
jgi:hypothetical protein